MNRVKFTPSHAPTLGVEIELALVDARTMALVSAAPELLSRLPEAMREWIKPELMQCYIEINSSICATVAEAETDLRRKLDVLEPLARDMGLRLLWSGTHPFSSWRDQVVTRNERYEGLITLLQDTARQLVTFGMHVHVGVESGDKAVMICDRLLRHVPTLLAISCNSPFWVGRPTGLHSWRSKVMEGLPTAGLPPLMRNWSEYVWLINHLIETGYIETIREIWWDIRPHHNFGTVEVRVFDVPGNLHDAMAMVALTHCLVVHLSDEIDEGAYQHDSHPMIIRQNKWRAARYGMETALVESERYSLHPVRDMVHMLVDRLRPTAQHLSCSEHLERILDVIGKPTSAQRQLEIFSESGNTLEVTRRMVESERHGT